MLKVALFDDDTLFLSLLEQKVAHIFKDCLQGIELLTYTDYATVKKPEIFDAELYFLDVFMPQISGIDFARELRRHNPSACIIFVSSMSDPVFEAIHCQPLRYIRKEYLQEELQEAIHAFLAVQQRTDLTHRFHATDKDRQILLSDIMYIESNAHYLTVHQTSETFSVRGKLSDYANEFFEFGFFAISKSYLVNSRFIQKLDGYDMVLHNNACLKISRGYKEEFYQNYLTYMRGVQYGVF